MAGKAILVFCAQALFMQSAFSQCTSRAAVDASGIGSPFNFAGPFAAPGLLAPGLAYDGLAYPAGIAGRIGYDGFYGPAMEFTATSGGAMPVTSSSAIAPVGISIVSENMYEGILNVVGELPFVGTTAMEGLLPTTGSGAINHACGTGVNAMSALSGTSTPASVATMGGPAFAAPGLAYDALYTPGFAAPAFAYDGLMNFGAPGLVAPALAYTSPMDAIEITPTRGGAMPVSSASASAPTGIAVASDNAYEGPLAVAGEVPFVGTVGLEGVVPSAGAGAVNHACGNGRNAMISENAAFAPAAAFAPMGGISPAALGYRGCGYAY